MRPIDRTRGLLPIGPLRVTRQLHALMSERATEQGRSMTNYIIDLIVRDLSAQGHWIEDHRALIGRRPSQRKV